VHDQLKCGKCGANRTQVIAQSLSPPGAFVQCLACGHSTLIASEKTKTTGSDVDRRRIERLVNQVIAESRVPAQVLAVDATLDGWRVTVKVSNGSLVKFDVKVGGLGAMRAAIERALAA
jgi:hypothetical protein